MSIILEGIDLAKMGERRRIVIYDNGDVVVNDEVWGEDGYKHYKTFYDIKAIQIPKGHGRLIDADALELEKEVELADDWKTAHEIANCVKYAPTILEEEK